MKTSSLYFAIFSLFTISLTACSSDDELNEVTIEDNNAIGFNVQTPNLTRAVDSYNNNSRPTRFKVTAYQGNANYYGGAIDEMASADGGYSWTSSQTRLWPVNKVASQNSLTFYAFIEHNDMDECTATGAPHSFDMSGVIPTFKNFKVNSDVTRQNDLMYAVAKDVSKSNSQKGNVNLNFRHALSQICFTAQNNDPTLDDVEIIAIEVGGIKGCGTYRFPESSTTTLPYESESKASLGEWAIDSNAPNERYVLADLSEHLGAPDASGNGKVRNISNPDFSDGQDARQTIDISRAMYLIPQKVAACSSESAQDGAYFKVTFNLNNTRASEPMTLFVPVSIDWKEGHRYVYNLVWEGKVISYSVNIADYQEVYY